MITIALFGESEKGAFVTPYLFQNLPELVDCLGNPPPESRGLYYAIQALLHRHYLLFFRVAEEGYSTYQYLQGLDILANEDVFPLIKAICVPGVGDQSLINAIVPICQTHHQILITNESDLYDYLSQKAA